MTDLPTVTGIADIPGWFPPMDQLVFEHFLGDDAVVPRGDLVELGVYLGKSAALIGRHCREDEVFTVCDLFGADPAEAANAAENNYSYRRLDRTAFEHNYLSLHESLPVIVEGLSSTITEHARAGSARFVHVDASHLYDQVVIDVQSARTLLLPDGVVVFDDFRSEHTPGVSAAVWESVATRGLRPICLTTQKFYGTFGDPGPHQEGLRAWLTTSPGGLRHEVQLVAGGPVVRVKRPPKPTGAPARADASPQVQKLQKRVAHLEKKVAGYQRRSPRHLAGRVVRAVRRAHAARRAERSPG